MSDSGDFSGGHANGQGAPADVMDVDQQTAHYIKDDVEERQPGTHDGALGAAPEEQPDAHAHGSYGDEGHHQGPFGRPRDQSEGMKKRIAAQLDYYFSQDNLFFDKWLKEKVLTAQDHNNGCTFSHFCCLSLS